VKGMKQCPICQGTGKVLEDSQEYEFLTRDPATNRCLHCDGKGLVGARKKLPARSPKKGLSTNYTDEHKFKAGLVMATLTLTGPAEHIIEMIRKMGGAQ
jgi:DnaJ-class molecular chaperone